MAKGFSQKTGFDYQDTFSPVVKAPTICIILTLALTRKRLLKKVDVNNAFLHGELNEVVYMTQPPGFEQCDQNCEAFVCKLNKARYGLREAPRAWFEHFKYFLLHTTEFTISLLDSCFYIKKTTQVVFFFTCIC